MSRSHLYVPGNSPEKLAKAPSLGADALMVDLVGTGPDGLGEDQAGARDCVARWLQTVPADLDVWVRINPGPVGHDDLREVVSPALRGLCLAKTESTTQLDALDAVLSTVETEAGLPARAVSVVPMLESAVAILAAPAIARAPRVVRLHIGEVHLRAELGLEPSEDEHELLGLRSQVVLASAAAGLAPPVAAGSADYRDLDRLRATTVAMRRMGFRGRACIHPAQVPVVNDVFA
jgi:citrate lyase subunit beta/citryl-CoA lyase